jgi:uncharacterized protein (DUF4415 family)
MRGEAMRKLTKEQKRDIAAIAAKKDADIDFSDVPAVVDWSGAEIGKFYRPRKKPVTMRLDADVLEWLKAYGKGYQTKANLLLRHAMVSTEGKSGSGKAIGGRRKRARRRSPTI